MHECETCRRLLALWQTQQTTVVVQCNELTAEGCDSYKSIHHTANECHYLCNVLANIINIDINIDIICEKIIHSFWKNGRCDCFFHGGPQMWMGHTWGMILFISTCVYHCLYSIVDHCLNVLCGTFSTIVYHKGRENKLFTVPTQLAAFVEEEKIANSDSSLVTLTTECLFYTS